MRASQVAKVASRIGATLVLTFDEGGVTGHPNHAATWAGTRKWLRDQHLAPKKAPINALGGKANGDEGGDNKANESEKNGPAIRGFKLITTSSVRRFIGALGTLNPPSSFSTFSLSRGIFFFWGSSPRLRFNVRCNFLCKCGQRRDSCAGSVGNGVMGGGVEGNAAPW
jgi:hypothetical protein